MGVIPNALAHRAIHAQAGRETAVTVAIELCDSAHLCGALAKELQVPVAVMFVVSSGMGWLAKVHVGGCHARPVGPRLASSGQQWPLHIRGSPASHAPPPNICTP